MKLGIGSDLHLEFLQPNQVPSFLAQSKRQNNDYLILTGDIADAPLLTIYLEMMANIFDHNIYFVLGNHDFYRGSIKIIRNDVKSLCEKYTNLKYLSAAQSAYWLDQENKIAVIGHDGWYDGEFGDYINSRFELNDFQLIGEFIGKEKWDRFSLMQQLASESTYHLARLLEEEIKANKGLTDIFIVTHVPPYAECCVTRYAENPEFSLPFYSNKTLGDLIRVYSDMHKEIQFTVFCGHTHRGICSQITDNLTVNVFSAEYNAPKIWSFEDIDRVQDS